MAQSFFDPTKSFGALAGWEYQTTSPSTTKTRAQALGASGDEIDHKLHDTKTTVTSTLVLKTAASAKIPKFGEILNGYHTDSVQIAFTNTGFVMMTLTGHKHGSANHPACRTYTGSLSSIAANFGCPATITGVTIPSGAGVRSATYTLTGNHIDELGSNGEYLAADNHDGYETMEVELADDGAITAASGWDITTNGNATGNTSITTASATAEKHLTADAAPKS